MKLAPAAGEARYHEDVRLIRQTTWTRPQGVVVANPKGGSGKTPTSLLLAGVLGDIRGGYVAAWEASEAPGTLAARAEGQPTRGLAELLERAERITSAGELGGFTAPQTSHADVVGSAGARALLEAADVEAVRAVLDTYYRITVADTGNNPQSAVFAQLVRSSDVFVIPTTVHPDAVDGVLALAAELDRSEHGRRLLTQAVVVVTHTGAPEPTGVLEELAEQLTGLGVAETVDVPHDPAIAAGGEITLAHLSEHSRRQWVRVAAAVVTSLQAANT
ncbi:hypothetical protein [Jannaschia sp. R86511]|uniref:MinD/ParA family ATP-binding protein n=1 Tax=Jannaschia sp. R86511 TaxID=3093853 RepID=UPI0036D4293A